jgi:hypothetical protein
MVHTCPAACAADEDSDTTGCGDYTKCIEVVYTAGTNVGGDYTDVVKTIAAGCAETASTCDAVEAESSAEKTLGSFVLCLQPL